MRPARITNAAWRHGGALWSCADRATRIIARDSGQGVNARMHRLFIAIRPPDEVCDLLLDTMEGVDGARWQDFDNLHLTLRFLGEVERPLADDLALELGRIAASPFPLTINGIGHFDASRRSGSSPHALWARIAEAPQLEALRLKVDRACIQVGLPADDRRFVPHITVARLNRSSGDIGPWMAAHGRLHAGPWQVDHFALFESHLGASGSRYEEIVRYPLR